MKLWIDDIRRPPSDEWIWVQSTHQAISTIFYHYRRQYKENTLLISLDHDAGEFAKYGGDYIEVLKWLEQEDIVDDSYSFHIHSMNPVGVQNMKNIIQHNNWRLI